MWATADYGATWRRIDAGFPEDDFVWVVREDAEQPGLLYAGAEWSGVWVSLDDGENWHSLRLNLPVTPVRDLKLKDGDVVAATHGRAHWILDDISPLRQLAAAGVALRSDGGEPGADAGVRLFTPRPTIRFREMVTRATFGGLFMPNPPSGVVVRYYLPQAPEAEVRLSIHEAGDDGEGEEIRTFSSRGAAAEPGPDPIDPADLVEPGLPAEAGANAFEWDMRYPEPIDWVPKTLYRHRDPYGPLAPPGRYEARLTVDGETFVVPFEIVPDPRVATPQAEFDEQFGFLMAIREKIGENHRAVARIHSLRQRIVQAIEGAAGTEGAADIARAGAELDARLWEIEDHLRQFRPSRDHRAKQELINWPVRLDDKFAKLLEHAEASDASPTSRDRMLFDDLSERQEEQIEALGFIEEGEAARFFNETESRSP
ncbi:WD40/YVTN/BNR-like repeat-containing protein [Candidatus Palauibacter sp.]|uniref:WD40/YVTN/BNR-like repeat-containing protein n=1 Tax=Candidatus Palauibacter sp. TaxID=3101350 RepID=UPI003B52978D